MWWRQAERQNEERAETEKLANTYFDKIREGDLIRAMGDLSGSLSAYRAGLVISERLAQQDPRNADWQRNLSANNRFCAEISG
jgi:hypothetical protein